MDKTSENRQAPVYDMGTQLSIEDGYKPMVSELFKGHQVEDISSELAQRKSGTDFLLRLRNGDGTFSAPIRCENKFEQKATGRQALEVVSVDRPRLIPGWMFTSRAAWLFSWYPSGELVAVPLDELRALVLKNPARHRSTTANNRKYLSWNILEDLNYVVQNTPNGCFIDLTKELGIERKEDAFPFMRGKSLAKRCTVDQLVERMRELPSESTPVPVTDAELQSIMQALLPLDYMAKYNAREIAQLSFLRKPALAA